MTKTLDWLVDNTIDHPSDGIAYLSWLGLAALVVTGFLVAVFAITIPFEVASCHSKADRMEFQSDWGVMTGCMINVDGQWVNISSYRVGEIND
jgi:hypothetical protein